MELKEIFLNLITEQPGTFIDDEGNLVDRFGNIIEPALDDNDPNEPEPEPETPEPSDAEPETPEQIDTPKPEKPKKLSGIQVLKLKWKEENPGLDDQAMNNAIMFFNRRKNSIIEYKTPGTINPITQQRHVNLPEIAALANRFPEMRNILSDHGKVRDIQNYTWEQMEFFIDRVNTQQTNVELAVKIEGDTPEIQKAKAYQVWENARNKVVNENNLVVIRVESKPESMALGYLQHILNKEETDREEQRTGRRQHSLNNNWCITWDPNQGNMYYNYRNRRSYYFVMDKSRDETDVYYLSVLQPIKRGVKESEFPYVITLRNNKGERIGLEWREVVDVWPALAGKENLIKFFELSNKERDDITVDKINFRESTEDNPNPYDFAGQGLPMQIAYIDSGRYINNTRCFDVLPFNQKKAYITKTSLDGSDYKKRFRCDDPSDPLGMLNLIQDSPGGLYRYLDEEILKERLKLTSGVHGLKIGIVGMDLIVLYSTMDEKYTLYKQRQTGLIGVMNMQTLGMIKPMEYTHSITQIVMDPEKMKPYYMYRYVEVDPGEDYFYFFMSPESLTGDKKSRGYMKGLFFDKDAGDDLFRTGKLRILKGY